MYSLSMYSRLFCILCIPFFYINYRLDDGFEVSTGFRSPWKPMYRRPEYAARGRLYIGFQGDLNLLDIENPLSKVFRP